MTRCALSSDEVVAFGIVDDQNTPLPIEKGEDGRLSVKVWPGMKYSLAITSGGYALLSRVYLGDKELPEGVEGCTTYVLPVTFDRTTTVKVRVQYKEGIIFGRLTIIV